MIHTRAKRDLATNAQRRVASYAVTSDGLTDFLAHCWTNAAAHAWTIVPNVLPALGLTAPHAEPWSTTLSDSYAGTLTLHGELRKESGMHARRCIVVVHGLGGSFDRHYCIRAAAAAQRAGYSCLRFSLRGADRRGEDFYHAGLAADITAAVASPALAEFDHIYVIGYSLGGHVTLRYALQGVDPRVRAVAAICAPLDLDLSALHIDGPRSFVYRRHVLQGLKEIYRAVAKHGHVLVPTPVAEVDRTQRIRDWDALTVVPRYGFRDVTDYYASMSVGPRLSELKLPSLLVQSSVDPMVPPWTYERHLATASAQLEVMRVRSGGHVAFPRMNWQNGPIKARLEDYVIGWFATR
jgi:predicted alpha/beta-fold hydrolase